MRVRQELSVALVRVIQPDIIQRLLQVHDRLVEDLDLTEVFQDILVDKVQQVVPPRPGINLLDDQEAAQRVVAEVVAAKLIPSEQEVQPVSPELRRLHVEVEQRVLLLQNDVHEEVLRGVQLRDLVGKLLNLLNRLLVDLVN